MRLLPVLAVAALCLGALPSAAGAEPGTLHMTVSAPQSPVRDGQPFSISVTLENGGADPVRAIDLTLAYTSDAISNDMIPQVAPMDPAGTCTEIGNGRGHECRLAQLDPGAQVVLTTHDVGRQSKQRCRGACALFVAISVRSLPRDAPDPKRQQLTIRVVDPVPAPASARVREKPRLVPFGRVGGKIALGVLGDPERFQSLTGQDSLSHHVIAGWGQGQTNPGFVGFFSSMGELPMFGIGTGGRITPGQIARGAGDDYLVALNQGLAEWGGPVYVRPLGEMNGHWNAYSAYDAAGHPKGPEYSTATFRKAFARIYLIAHGGPAVNARLRRLGLPPVKATLAANPRVRLVWNPQGYGSPDVPGNSAQAYYPGDAYVDVVGDDLYDIKGKAEWAAAEALYRAHPGKPFAFPEWGLWGLDDPAFVAAMAKWIGTHPRTELASYYSGETGSVFDLASKPRSRAAYRRLILPLGRRP